MARFYIVAIEQSLFGDHAVVRSWGRIGTKGRSLIELYQGQEQARERQVRLIRAKQRRGYTPGDAP